jgi:hypothetical protein
LSQHSTKPARIRFRSVRDRSFEDQTAAMERGYNSVMELAFDEMLQALVELQERVDRLEGKADALPIAGSGS